MKQFDLVCVGRAAVDLYGEQIGARLEDVSTFARYLGGSPANTAVGCARLGLRCAMLTRVGAEQNGEFVRKELARAGVDVSHVLADPARLTALVFLGVCDEHNFPLLFYRDNCADMALAPEDVDPSLMASAGAVLISGTHLSQATPRAACRKVIEAAVAAGTRVVLDIDFRPVLWGLRPLSDGATRYVESDAVTDTLREFLPFCDLIVGTEEEFAIAGGGDETAAAIDAVRARSRATLVVKRGAAGCTVVVAGEPPGAALTVSGLPIEVFNVLGAGDAFMAGFLSGWLRDRPLVDCCQRANACGALVVSRHGCAPAMPTQHELEHLLAHGSSTLRLREDATLNHLHRAALRDADPSPLAILACDHRAQFEALAGEDETASARITAFKRLVTRGARRALAARTSPPVGGLIIDDRYGASLLLELDTEFWIARPVESPGQRPLEFERGRNIVSLLREWPRHHVAKCLVAFDPYDPLPMRRTQIDRMLDLAAACAATQRELLLEVVLPAIAPVAVADQRLLDAVREIGAAGVLPDWWKLPAPTSGDGWDRIASVVRTLDSQCRGVLVLGLDAPLAELAPRISTAAKHPVCRGFAVGRSIFGTAAREWFAGRIDDDAAIEQIASRYGELVDLLDATGIQASKRAGERAATTPPSQYDTTLISEDSQWTGSVS